MPGARAHHGFGNCRHRFVLPDDALVQLFGQVQQFLHLSGQQPRYGHAGPAAHDLRNVFFIHLFLEEPRLPLLLDVSSSSSDRNRRSRSASRP